MFELIALIILILSLGGIVLISVKKIPVLSQMSEINEGIFKENIIDLLKKRIKNISFDKLIFLKMLSKIRIYTLKAEKYVDNHLQKMRKKIVKKQEKIKKEENNPSAGGPSTTPS